MDIYVGDEKRIKQTNGYGTDRVECSYETASKMCVSQ